MSLQAAPLVAQPAADLVQRFAARLDQQFPSRPAGFLSPVVTNVEAQEIEPLREMDDPGLGIGQPQPPYRQPGRDLRLSGMGVCFGLAKDHEVVRVSHQGAGPIELAPGFLFDPKDLLNAGKRNVGQQRRDAPPNAKDNMGTQAMIGGAWSPRPRLHRPDHGGSSGGW